MEDGSDNLNNGGGIEIVTKPYRTKEGFTKAINRFINYFSKNGEYELKEVLEFNKTCGLHAHLSLLDGRKFNQYSFYDSYRKARRYFLKAIENSNINETAKELIKTQYFRHYARRSTRLNIYGSQKYQEFNLGCEFDGVGIEWRSLNCRGVQTWAEFREFMNILHDSITFLVDNVLNFKRNRSFTLDSRNLDLKANVSTEVIEIETPQDNATTENIMIEV